MTIKKTSVAVVAGAGAGLGRSLASKLMAEGVAGLAIANVVVDSDASIDAPLMFAYILGC